MEVRRDIISTVSSIGSLANPSKIEVPDSFKKIMLVRDVVKPTYDERGILIMSVYDFLLNGNSLD